MNTEKIASGVVHFVDKNRVVRSHNGKLYQSFDLGISWEFLIDITSGYREKILARSRLLSRLFRLHVYHIVPNQSNWVLFGMKKIYFLTYDLKKILSKDTLSGSRPLNVCSNEKGVYYGEYKNNKKRKPVSVWHYSNNTNKWRQASQFDNVRHIHGVHYDPFDDLIWVTTGDRNEESYIWRTQDDFQSIEKETGGTQQQRSIKLLFTGDSVYFGSDTPEETNHLYKISRYDNTVIKLARVGGSVFHGCKVGNWLFFSTAVEKSSVNTSPYSEVWASPDGEKWQCILRYKKDCWDKKYFQYGQVFFPGGPGDDENLWLTPFATKFDQRSFKIDLNNVAKLYKNGGITFK